MKLTKNRLKKLAGLLKEQTRENVEGPYYVEEDHMMYGNQIVADRLQTEEEAKRVVEKLYAQKNGDGWSNYTIRHINDDDE